MKILITGAKGYIGSNLVERLAEESEVIAFDCLDKPLFSLETPNVTYVQGDLTDKDAFKTIPGDLEGIVHLGGISRVKDGKKDTIQCMRVNVLGTLNVLALAQSQQFPPWIIYGGTHESIENVYGLSKHIGELCVERFAEDLCLRAFSLRFSTVYGLKDRPDKLIPTLLNQALNNQDITLSNSSLSFDFIHIDDIIRGINHGIEYLRRPGPSFFDSMSLCTGVNTSLKELARLIINLTKSKSKIKVLDKTETPSVLYKTDEAERELDFRAKISIKEGIRKSIGEYT